MKKLWVLYDADCGLCRRARRWMLEQPAFLELEFLAAEGPEARKRFPTLASAGRPEELVAVDDEGGVYRGGQAWLICLYALEDYREWSQFLAKPALLPMARAAFYFLSHNRSMISGWLGRDGEERLKETLARENPVACAGGKRP